MTALTGSSPGDEHLIALWLHGRSVHTQRAYASDLRRFRIVTGKSLVDVTLEDLHSFALSLDRLAPATQYRILSAVKSLLAFGHRIGMLPADAGRVLRLPAVRNRLAERILSEPELHRILSLEPNPRNRAMLNLLYSAGIRVSELCELAWRDLQPNGDAGQITIFGKGGKTRSVRLPAAVWQQLCGLRDGNTRLQDPVFRSRKNKYGGGLRPLAVFRMVRKAAARANVDLPVSPHWFRHSHASHALDHGAPIHLVQATLGHASITTTGRYLHARPQESSGDYLAVP